MKNNIIMGSRKSILAMVQTELVKSLLSTLGDYNITIKGIITEGDKRLDRQLADIGGKGLFLKELDNAMLEKRIDLSVHSLKDVPYDVEPGLAMVAIPERENFDDVFISNKYPSLEELPEGAVIGTSSLRRQCLLNHYYPHLNVVSIRGNIHTRLKKMDDNEFDGLILAKAGLIRTHLTDRITQNLDPLKFVPAIGQGALAVYCREDDEESIALLKQIDHADTRLCVTTERMVSSVLHGGCHMPLAVNAQLNGERIHINAMIGMPNGDDFISISHQADKKDHKKAAMYVAQQLKDHGAEKIIKSLS